MTTSGRSRALVLAGAGAAGNAWEIGLLAGLFEERVVLTDADLIVGTSAGATVAAQVTSGAALEELLASIQDENHRVPPSAPTAAPTAVVATDPGRSGEDALAWSDAVIASSRDPSEMRRKLGRAALERDLTGGSASLRWRAVVAGRLPSSTWPQQRLLLPAVHARTGKPVLFDRDSGVDLVDAVAASTSAMTPYWIGEQPYLNGGYRRSENADLAAGYERVLVLSPFSGRSRMPAGWGMSLATQVEELEAGGSVVMTVFPDARAGDVFGARALDPATRPQAAQGGYEQGRDLAAGLRGFWA